MLRQVLQQRSRGFPGDMIRAPGHKIAPQAPCETAPQAPCWRQASHVSPVVLPWWYTRHGETSRLWESVMVVLLALLVCSLVVFVCSVGVLVLVVDCWLLLESVEFLGICTIS